MSFDITREKQYFHTACMLLLSQYKNNMVLNTLLIRSRPGHDRAEITGTGISPSLHPSGVSYKTGNNWENILNLYE